MNFDTNQLQSSSAFDTMVRKKEKYNTQKFESQPQNFDLNDISKVGEIDKQEESYLDKQRIISIQDQNQSIITNNQANVIKSSKTITKQLSDIVERVRLRQAAKKLVNSTRSRMLKNMKPQQYSLINDKSQDFTDMKKDFFQNSILSFSFQQRLKLAHGCACFWIIAGRLSQKYQDQNWLSSQNIEGDSWNKQYLSEFYFCCVTMTTVSYRDISPQSTLEMFFCIIILLFACGVFGFSFNTIQAILKDFSKAENEILDKMYIIKNYLNKKQINQTLYKNYFWRGNQQTNQEEEEKMIKQLHDNLRNELLKESNKIVLRDSLIFKNNFSEEVIHVTIPIIHEINFTLLEIIYTENDENIDRFIYFVQDGIVEVFLEVIEHLYAGQGSIQKSYKTIKRLKK
ncbi:hypothetical protein ABPG72_000135 [Tetrahymena utriculariae]